MSKEAMKLALEALENHCGNYKLDDAGCDRHEKATTALKEALAQPEQTEVQRLIALVRAQQITIDKLEAALAQPEQEPTFYRHKDGHFMKPERAKFLGLDLNDLQALYTAPPAQPAPVQEPVAWMDVNEKGAIYGLRYWSEPDNRHEIALYTTPPQRTWVGLTDEDANKIYTDGSTFGEMMRMVEAKLRSKNEHRG